MEIRSTRLRYVSSVDPEMISQAITALPFKVEIKGGPLMGADGRWYVWFVIPDVVPELANLVLP